MPSLRAAALASACLLLSSTPLISARVLATSSDKPSSNSGPIASTAQSNATTSSTSSYHILQDITCAGPVADNSTQGTTSPAPSSSCASMLTNWVNWYSAAPEAWGTGPAATANHTFPITFSDQGCDIEIKLRGEPKNAAYTEWFAVPDGLPYAVRVLGLCMEGNGGTAERYNGGSFFFTGNTATNSESEQPGDGTTLEFSFTQS